MGRSFVFLSPPPHQRKFAVFTVAALGVGGGWGGGGLLGYGNHIRRAIRPVAQKVKKSKFRKYGNQSIYPRKIQKKKQTISNNWNGGMGAALYKAHPTELRGKADGAANLFQRRQFKYRTTKMPICAIKTLHF